MPHPVAQSRAWPTLSGLEGGPENNTGPGGAGDSPQRLPAGRAYRTWPTLSGGRVEGGKISPGQGGAGDSPQCNNVGLARDTVNLADKSARFSGFLYFSKTRWGPVASLFCQKRVKNSRKAELFCLFLPLFLLNRDLGSGLPPSQGIG